MTRKYTIFIILLSLSGITLYYCSSRPTVPDFNEYEAGIARKTAFFNYFLPIIQEQNNRIMSHRKHLIGLQANKDNIGWWDSRNLNNLATDYRMEEFSIDKDTDWQELLRRVDSIPASLVLAQAANESAWGTSSFALEGNNYFGQWCFSKGCGIVPGKRNDGAKHEVAVFDSPKASVISYFYNLNTFHAYQSLRGIRSQLKRENKPVTGYELAAGLNKYSERGDEYIKELRSMISFNGLTKYDTVSTSE